MRIDQHAFKPRMNRISIVVRLLDTQIIIWFLTKSFKHGGAAAEISMKWYKASGRKNKSNYVWFVWVRGDGMCYPQSVKAPNWHQTWALVWFSNVNTYFVCDLASIPCCPFDTCGWHSTNATVVVYSRPSIADQLPNNDCGRSRSFFVRFI